MKGHFYAGVFLLFLIVISCSQPEKEAEPEIQWPETKAFELRVQYNFHKGIPAKAVKGHMDSLAALLKSEKLVSQTMKRVFGQVAGEVEGVDTSSAMCKKLSEHLVVNPEYRNYQLTLKADWPEWVGEPLINGLVEEGNFLHLRVMNKQWQIESQPARDALEIAEKALQEFKAQNPDENSNQEEHNRLLTARQDAFFQVESFNLRKEMIRPCFFPIDW